VEILCYRYGYAGLLRGDSFSVDGEVRKMADRLLVFGGSTIGNSRVKLTNSEDCVRRGLVREGEDPQTVAADQLAKDGIDVLHAIGGDDTNIVAAQLAAHLSAAGYRMAVIGLPKTIDNDIFPISRSLGAETAAQETANYFTHVVNECTTAPRMLIVHEVMGRHCGWLTAASAMRYRGWLDRQKFLGDLGLDRRRWDVHGVYIPEMEWDMAHEIGRLRGVMDSVGNVNLFVSEGAGLGTILKEMEKESQDIPRDAFGHVKLDMLNPGKWFGEKMAEHIGAEKTLVQKSGYYARSSAPNEEDVKLIRASVDLAVDAALEMRSGVIGLDQDLGDVLACISFGRIRGGKPYGTSDPKFRKLLAEIGQV
jgi:pyrophosphate--fructose-6-phosphate 1-phosphotransferase